MRSMAIDYGNPVGNLAQGLHTGMSLGSMFKKQDNSDTVPIPDPGQKPVINAAQVLTGEQNDFDVINQLNKQTKGLDPDAKKRVFDTAIKSGQIKTGIGQSVATNVDMMKPDELNIIINSVKNNSPSAPTNIQSLIERLGGDQSIGGAAVKSKISEVRTLQSEADKEWAIKAMDTLTVLDDVHRNPKNFMGKSGNYHPSVPLTLQQEGNYLQGLQSMGGEYKTWADKYLENINQRQRITRSGGKPDQYVGIDKQTGKRIDSVSTPNFMDRVKPGSVDLMNKEESTTRIIRETKNKSEGTPEPIKPGALKKLTQADIDRFMKENGNDPVKATAAAKKAGYDTSK